MIPIVSIVGRSNSGKTTLIEKIIPLLVKKGYRIATVKHCSHGFE
ncbi:MAG: molybdopterin-guanine dinucleotide biosynthesis protein MobB, partial [Nitrospirae bacterium]|nr:molybdopterin-guanine dinucleotide biosynthesis protein MobB [Nitrospirota bacterium]